MPRLDVCPATAAIVAAPCWRWWRMSTVLIVEDEALVAMDLEQAVSDASYRFLDRSRRPRERLISLLRADLT